MCMIQFMTFDNNIVYMDKKYEFLKSRFNKNYSKYLILFHLISIILIYYIIIIFFNTKMKTNVVSCHHWMKKKISFIGDNIGTMMWSFVDVSCSHEHVMHRYLDT